MPKKEKQKTEEAQDFYDGNHWRDSRGYMGPLPAGNDEDAADILANISRSFTSRNVVKETTTRTVDGVLGKEPDWKLSDTKILTRTQRAMQRLKQLKERSFKAIKRFTSLLSGSNPEDTALDKEPPSPDKPADTPPNQPPPPVKPEDGTAASATDPNADPLMTEAETALTTLWEDPQVGKALKDCLIGRLVTGRGCIRVYVPRRFLSDDGSVESVGDLNEAIKTLRIEYVTADRARVLDHEGEKISIVSLDILPKGGGTQPVKAIEVGYVDDGKTFITVVSNEQGGRLATSGKLPGEPGFVAAEGVATDPQQKTAEGIAPLLKSGASSSGLALGGNLTVAELEGEPFVSQQLVQNNKLLNLALTMAGTALVEGGFPEMAILNAAFAQEPKPGAQPAAGSDMLSPIDLQNVQTQSKPIKRGPAVVQKVIGLRSTDTEGNQTFLTPEVKYKDPTPLTTFSEGKDLAYTNCLEEAHQLFVKISGDSEASGESRLQARGDFLQRLHDYKPDVDRIGSWMLTTALHYAAILAGQPDHFKDLIVKFDSKLYAGPLTSDERRTLIEQYEAGLMSEETAMIMLGTDNIEEEKRMIAVEKEEKMGQQAMQFRLQAEQSKKEAETGQKPPAPPAK